MLPNRGFVARATSACYLIGVLVPGQKGFWAKGFWAGVRGFEAGVRGFRAGLRVFGAGVRGFGAGVRGFGAGVRGFGVGVGGFGVGLNVSAPMPARQQQKIQKRFGCQNKAFSIRKNGVSRPSFGHPCGGVLWERFWGWGSRF